MEMEQTECFETSVYKIQTPRNYPEESIKHVTYILHSMKCGEILVQLSC